jgi:homoserine O-acetyltransferase
MSGASVFVARDVALECGTTIPQMPLAYKTVGTLNAARDNVVVYCTHFGATHVQCEFLLGPGQPLDPARQFIVFVNLTGNGLSASPTTMPPPFDGPRFPVVSIRDNVRLQMALLDELGLCEVALVMGHSMGALQTFEWAALFPNTVRAILPFCGAARVSDHNATFLRGMLAILEGSPEFANGAYTVPPTAMMKTIGQVWSPWAPGHGFYRNRGYETLGFANAKDFVDRYWQETFAGFDANNLVSQIRTWLTADIASNPAYGEDIRRALGAITARAIIMPSRTDPYFPPEDGAFEASQMPNAEFRPIPSNWGHWAGSGRNPEDTAFIGQAVTELLV